MASMEESGSFGRAVSISVFSPCLGICGTTGIDTKTQFDMLQTSNGLTDLLCPRSTY